MVYFN